LHVDWNAVKKAVTELREYVLKKSGFKLPQIQQGFFGERGLKFHDLEIPMSSGQGVNTP